MFRNMVALLFLFALALPAVAMGQPASATTYEVAVPADCHGTPMPVQDHETPKHEGSDMRLHGCIGCIAPIAPTYAVRLHDTIVSDEDAGPEKLMSGTAARPTIPPPRT